MNIKEEIKNRIIELVETGTSKGVRKSWEIRRQNLLHHLDAKAAKYMIKGSVSEPKKFKKYFARFKKVKQMVKIK